jgi:hypothetical protein
MNIRYYFFFFILAFCAAANAQQADTLTDYFVPNEFMQSMGLNLSTSNSRMHVWNGPIDAGINNVVDIRWTFNTKEEAAKYFKDNFAEQSENGKEYPVPASYGMDVQQLHVYRETPLIANLYAGMGTKHVQWYFIFLEGKVMIKVFTNGWNTSYATARTIASKAAEVTAAKQKIIYNNYPLPVFTLPDNVSALLKRTHAIYDAPPGYNPVEVKENPDVKYHYAVIHPSKESEIRYFILPFDSIPGEKNADVKIKHDETFAYSVFFADVLNLRGVADKNLPDMYEIKEEKLEKNYNADKGWITYIEAKSQFAQGYRYCMVTCLYKKGIGLVEVFHLATDKKWFTAEPQITPFTMRFSD